MRFGLLLIFFLAVFFGDVECKDKQPLPFEQIKPAPKYDNPGQVRDRERHMESRVFEKAKQLNNIGVHRPSVMGDDWNKRYRQPFHPAWMDYCDPYHCNDYHKIACGLNRMTMRFKWFQSGCHIAINNICVTYKGTLKYDMIDPKYCTMYVMHLRSSCPQQCDDVLEPVCGISSYDNHVVIFQNTCFFEKANCEKDTFNEYEEVHMDICRNTLAYEKLKKVKKTFNLIPGLKIFSQ